METNQYIDDLKDIRRMMNQSTQCLSLSGLAGVLAGCYALIGAGIAHFLMEKHSKTYIILESKLFAQIIGIALIVLLLSVVTAFYLSHRKARKMNETLWNASAKRLMINFLIPLAAGGIFSFLLLRQQVYGLIAPVTLIFYGLACINASKYTLRDVRYLGLTVLILGLLATEFSGYGLEFWALGFGVCHIIYGTIMYRKYDLKK